jgi:hypothetical protein
MGRITRAEREMEQLLQLAGLRDDLRKLTAENERLRGEVVLLTASNRHRGAALLEADQKALAATARAEAAERDCDEARQAAVDLAKKVGIEKVLAAETARADEAQAHAADLRGALEELKAEYESAGSRDDERKVTYNWSLTRINAALTRTPPQCK